METNILKHSIFSEEVVYNETSEQSIDTDLTLPDYFMPIKKILKCKTTPRITSKSINGQNLFVDFSLNINIMYVDDSNCIQSYSHIIPVTKSFDLNSNFENSIINCTITGDYINCRAVTENKISLHGAVSVNAIIKSKKQMEIITDIDNTSIEMLRDTSTATIPMGEGEKNLIIEEEISIGNGQASVETLLRYDAIPIIEEFKIISNKVIAKGNLKVIALYTSKDGVRPQNFSAVLPFSQIVDIEGVNEACKCECNAHVVFCELKQRAGEEECRSFLLTAKLLISANAYCSSDIPIILDAYSTKCEISTKKEEICFNNIKEGINDKFIAKKKLEFSDGSIGSIIDLWCDCETKGYKIEGKTVLVSGRIIVQILAYDTDSLPIYLERPIDFDYKYEIHEKFDSVQCKICAEISNSSFTILSANELEIAVELNMLGALYNLAASTVITDIEIFEDRKKNLNYDSGILIYFARSGEKLWDIAKRYNSCREEIKNLNNCSDENLIENKGLIIPIK